MYAECAGALVGTGESGGARRVDGWVPVRYWWVGGEGSVAERDRATLGMGLVREVTPRA